MGLFGSKKDPIETWLEHGDLIWSYVPSLATRSRLRVAVGRYIAGEDTSRELVGFGAGAVVPLVTAAALSMAGEVIGPVPALLRAIGDDAAAPLVATLGLELEDAYRDVLRQCGSTLAGASNGAALRAKKAREIALDGLSEVAGAQSLPRPWFGKARAMARAYDGAADDRIRWAAQALARAIDEINRRPSAGAW